MNIPYLLQDFDDITILISNEKQDWSHKESIREDDYGFIVTCYVELHFETEKEGRKAALGQFYYFVPHGEKMFDVTKIIPELLYQSFCRIAGFVMCKLNELVSRVPSLYELTQSFESKDLLSR